MEITALRSTKPTNQENKVENKRVETYLRLGVGVEHWIQKLERSSKPQTLR